MSETSEKGTLTITVANPKNAEKPFTYVIKQMDHGTYYMMQKIIRSGKQFDAYVYMINALKVSGDDPKVLLNDPEYVPCLLALDGILADMLEPVEASIKKN